MSVQKHIPVVWLWMGALLLSSVGICVQQLYCFCSGKTAFVVLAGSDTGCADIPQPEADDCCKNTDLPACPALEGFSDKNGSCCAKTGVQFLHLQADYTFSQSSFKIFNCPVWADELPAFFHLYRPAICAARLTNKAPPEPPPPLPGRIVCLRHELLRC